MHAPLFGPPCILCNAATAAHTAVYSSAIRILRSHPVYAIMTRFRVYDCLTNFPDHFFSFYIVYGIQRLRFISCFIKQWLIDWHFVRYVSVNHADGEFEFHDLCISSDEKLFNKILTCPNHILWTRLPPATAQNYSLRNRNTSILLF